MKTPRKFIIATFLQHIMGSTHSGENILHLLFGNNPEIFKTLEFHAMNNLQAINFSLSPLSSKHLNELIASVVVFATFKEVGFNNC